MMTEMAVVLRLWKEQGIDLNPPASNDGLLRLASMLGNPLRPDLEEFYQSADGMRDGQMNGWHVSFRPIERVMREMDVVPRGERHWWALADVLIDSSFFRICPEGERTLVFTESTQAVFDIFRLL
jgi:hypothetical protein